MIKNEIHFFDLDGTLWNIDSKVWIIAKDNPNVPLYKLNNLEYTLVKKNIYKKDDILIEYNDRKFWIPKSIYDCVYKKRKLDPEFLGLSFREFFDINYIDEITVLLKNISHLYNKTNINFGILSARFDKDSEKELLNLLREKLKQNNISIDKIYYVGENLVVFNRDTIAHLKSLILLEHLVGIKIVDNKFIPIKQDWFENVYFYDDEIENIQYANNIQNLFNEILKNTTDMEVFNIIKEKINNFNLKLTTNLITNNEYNKFKTNEIILTEPIKFPLRTESIKKFNEY